MNGNTDPSPPVIQVHIVIDEEGHGSLARNPVVVSVQNTLLQFKMIADGYSFASVDAIQVQNGGEAFSRSWTLSPFEAQVVDFKRGSGRYDYTVTAVGPQGNTVVVPFSSPGPQIENQ